MSNFNERHPPMGSETDRDSQTIQRSEYISSSSSSSFEELDELSLRVQALLAESDDEQMPACSSCKESQAHQESQMSPQSSEAGSDIQAACSSSNLECHHHMDKVILPKKEREQVSENIKALKDPCSKTDYDASDIQETSFSYSCEVFEERKVCFEDHTERVMTDNLCSGTDVTIIEDLHSNRHRPSVSSVTSHSKLEISNDSTSYYRLDEDLEKQTVNNHLKGKCCDTKLPLLGTSFSTSSDFFYYTPCENKEKLSIDKKSDHSSYFTPGFSPQQSHENEKDCSLCSRCGDCDTPSLSVSSITSSKRLEWDNAADIGYARDTVDESSSQRKSRKEPDGFSLAAHKHSYSASSKCNKDTKQQLSAKDTSLISEREHTSKVSQTLNLNDESPVSEDSYITEDFSRKARTVVDETLEYSDAKSSIVFESNISFEKEPELQIHSDLSVRPKTYLKERDSERKTILPKDSERKTILPKDPETNLSYLKDTESEIAKSDFVENIHMNRDSETSKRRVSFASSKTFEGNVKVVSFMKPVQDVTQVRSFEPPSCQSISDLPEEYQKHILTAPIFIDSEMLPSDNCSRRPITDNPISSSDVLPHIRWYPIPSYKSSQDIKNAATQTSLRQSKEAETSSEMSNELDKNIIDSSDIIQHLHVTKNPVDTVLTLEYATKYMETDDPNEFFNKSQQTEVKNSDVIRHSPVKRIIDRSDLNIRHLPQQENNYRSLDEMNLKNVVGGIKRDEYDDIEDGVVTSAFQYSSDDDETDSPDSKGTYIVTAEDKQKYSFDSKGKVFKDASTQVKNCDCFGEFKNMLKKALDKIPDDQVCPFHKILKKELKETKQTKRVPLYSEAYDVLFFGDNACKILDAENSPFYFTSILMSPLRHIRKRKCVKKLPEKEKPRCNKEIKSIGKKEQFLKTIYRNHAKKYSKLLAKSATKGKVDYTRHERVLKKSPYYQ